MFIYQLIDGIDNAAGHITGSFIHADKSGRIATVEIAHAKFGLLDNFLYVIVRMEQF